MPKVVVKTVEKDSVRRWLFAPHREHLDEEQFCICSYGKQWPSTLMPPAKTARKRGQSGKFYFRLRIAPSTSQPVPVHCMRKPFVTYQARETERERESLGGRVKVFHYLANPYLDSKFAPRIDSEEQRKLLFTAPKPSGKKWIVRLESEFLRPVLLHCSPAGQRLVAAIFHPKTEAPGALVRDRCRELQKPELT